MHLSFSQRHSNIRGVERKPHVCDAIGTNFKVHKDLLLPSSVEELVEKPPFDDVHKWVKWKPHVANVCT